MAETIKKENAAVKDTAKKPAGEKFVTIRLPRIGKNDSAEFVSVNERTWLVKRGVEVQVPECVAKVIRNSELMQEEAFEFENSVQH